MKHLFNKSFGPSETDVQIPQGLSESLQGMVEDERARSMKTMPAERIMRAVRASKASASQVLEQELVSWFRPVIAAGLLVVMMLAAYNFELSRRNDAHQTTTEMVLGLHPVTVADAYPIDFDGH